MRLEIQENACGLVRKLIADGLDPNEVLEFYRGDVLCLHGKASAFAKVKVRELEDVGPFFVPWEPMPPEKKGRVWLRRKAKDGLRQEDPSPHA